MSKSAIARVSLLLIAGWRAACSGSSDDDDSGQAGDGAGQGGTGSSGSGGHAGGGSGGHAGGGSGGHAGMGSGGNASGDGGAAGPALELEQVAAGGAASCGVRSGGTLWCWGENKGGNLVGPPAQDIVHPTQLGTDDDWSAVSAGALFQCALKTDGRLLCWGDNTEGQLGITMFQATTAFPPMPVSVEGPWATVATGFNGACGITMEGALFCWGDKSMHPMAEAQMRVGTDTDWTQVSVGKNHACGLKKSGALWCWGSNEYGQLGQGGPTPYESDPTQPFSGLSSSEEPLQVGTDSDWIEVGSGGQYSCALKSGGAIWCWGDNEDATLGDGTSDHLSSSPKLITGANKSSHLFVGDVSACAINDGGELWCWGNLLDDEVGGGMAKGHTTPVQIDGSKAWESVDLSAHACALTRDGSTYCWGANERGQLGDGSADQRSGLVAVAAPK